MARGFSGDRNNLLGNYSVPLLWLWCVPPAGVLLGSGLAVSAIFAPLMDATVQLLGALCAGLFPYLCVMSIDRAAEWQCREETLDAVRAVALEVIDRRAVGSDAKVIGGAGN